MIKGTEKLDRIGRGSQKAGTKIRFDARLARIIGEDLLVEARKRVPIGKTQRLYKSGKATTNRQARTITVSFRALRAGGFDYAQAMEFGTRYIQGRWYLTGAFHTRHGYYSGLLRERALQIIRYEWG